MRLDTSLLLDAGVPRCMLVADGAVAYRPQDVNASISLDQAFQHLATAQVILQRLTDVDASGKHYAIQGQPPPS